MGLARLLHYEKKSIAEMHNFTQLHARGKTFDLNPMIGGSVVDTYLNYRFVHCEWTLQSLSMVRTDGNDSYHMVWLVPAGKRF